MIEVEGLSKRFGEVTALSNVTFSVPKGKIVGFLGANGAGKTTTMDIICGVSGPDSGTVRVCGHDVAEASMAARKCLGYLPDVSPIYDDMRVGDYVSYAATLHGLKGSTRRSRVDEILGRLALVDVRRRLIGNLSKGYRQRVALAQALVHDPEVLVLDEPTEGLDPNQIVQIRELIKGLGGRHTVILSSHILSEVEATCDSIVIIHKGRIVEQGTYQDIVRKRFASDTYRIRVEQDVERAAGACRAVRGVTGVQVEGPRDMVVTLAQGSDVKVTDEVAKTVLAGGFGLRQFGPQSHSLEDVFFELTK